MHDNGRVHVLEGQVDYDELILRVKCQHIVLKYVGPPCLIFYSTTKAGAWPPPVHNQQA